MSSERPKVGLGVIVLNDEGKVLIGKRKGSHAAFYSIPGGHLELGETFEAGAVREIKEEANIDIIDPEVIGVTNNLDTYEKEGKHYISVIVLARSFSGELQVMEPEKNDGWLWCDPHDLPQPHFDASEMGIQCYLDGRCYVGRK